MTDTEARIGRADPGLVDEAALVQFVARQRWFGGKSRDVVGASILDATLLRSSSPYLVLALVEVRFQPGTHDLYQLLFGFRPDEDGWKNNVIARADGWTVYGGLADPTLSRELLHFMRGGRTFQSEEAAVDFRSVGALEGQTVTPLDVWPLESEQSNTSVVFDDELILKCYRRLEAGINPELELLRFLTARGFEGTPRLEGWYSYSGRLIDTTLGIAQAYVPAVDGGWEFARAALRGEAEDDFLATVRRLGEVTGEMHVTLASDPTDPAFAPEEPSVEALGILTATMDEEIERVFLDLPDTDVLAPIAGRGEEVREQLRQLSQFGAVGRVIRHHGDYHLGQVLWTGSDWVVLDFEGEPARSLAERRRKRSPLRDVAGMLRSFAYAASAATITDGIEAPEGWEQRARDEFLSGYLPAVEAQGLLPPSQEATERLLAIYELEKAVYELRYELDNRPDWVEIPVAGIVRLLGISAEAA